MDDKLFLLELERINQLLADCGIFLMIDILLVSNDTSFLHKFFMKLERGEYLRTIQGYRQFIERYFFINECEIERSHSFSINHRLNPLYNDLLVFECTKKKE